jgi:hypothetical protein
MSAELHCVCVFIDTKDADRSYRDIRCRKPITSRRTKTRSLLVDLEYLS